MLKRIPSGLWLTTVASQDPYLTNLGCGMASAHLEDRGIETHTLSTMHVMIIS